MSRFHDDLSDIGLRFTGSGDGDQSALHEYLQIRPPEQPATSPPILAFTRKREVQIPWSEILGDIGADGATSVAALREYFEASWPFDKPLKDVLDTLSKALIDGDPPLVSEFTPPPGDSESVPTGFWRTRFEDDGTAKAEPVKAGIVIRHASTGRSYLATPTQGETLTKDHFTPDLYEKAWERIGAVELVFDNEEDAKTYYTAFEEVDLRPVVIERKYKELEILQRYATDVATKVKEATRSVIDNIIQAGLDPAEIERAQQRGLRLEISEFDVKQRLQRLAAQAANLGFRLPLVKEQVEIPGKEPKETKDLEVGKLYAPYARVARWPVFYVRPQKVTRRFLGIPYAATRLTGATRYQEQKFTDYAPVDTSRDLLSAKLETLVTEGLQAFVFEQTPAGFATADGTRLQALMERCKFDEAFRRNCAVLLPVYETSLTGQRMVAKYSVFKRPQPGLLPTTLPRLAVAESLSYRTAWRQTLLGELVTSINLAPGEERRVTISRRFEQETTVTRSTTSIFDVSSSESTDLATEMENQTRQEQESSSNLSFSTRASGSYGLLSAEATASGGTNHSLKDVSQAIARVAKKAARSVSQQNREEVSSTSSARTTVSNTDETVATLRNINEGRTLNLMFYRLYNKFSGGLYLDGLGFDVIPGVEVIAGSGVHESVSFGLHEFPELVRQFSEARLPFHVADDKVERYRGRLLDSIEDLLYTEYWAPPDGDRTADTESVKGEEGRDFVVGAVENAGTPAAAATSVGLLRLPGGARPGPQPVLMGARTPEDIETRVQKLAGDLRAATVDSGEPMQPQDLLVAAPGFYLDAMVGLRPSTEQYSEQMRAQQVRMRAAEVFAKESEAVYQRAQAMRLARLRPGTGNGGNYLTGILPDAARNSLTLIPRYPLGPGRWSLLFDGDHKERTETDGGEAALSFSWGDDAPQNWLGAADLVSRIELFDEASQTSVRFEV